MTPQTFIFFGPSGSGKGEQARLLMDVLREKDHERKIIYIETGEKFRELIATNSYTALLTKEIVDFGGLMPEFMPIYIWTKSLVDNFSGEEHIFFDGTPRKLIEAQILDSAIKFYKMHNPVVVSLEVSDEELTKRLLGRGRKDDTEQGIKKRLSWYKENVMPSIEHFKNNPYYKFISISGERSIEEVHQDLVERVFS